MEFEDKYELQKISLSTELAKLQQEQYQNKKADKFTGIESKYFEVMEKLTDKELCFTDLSTEERQVVRNYLKIQADVAVKSKYPELKLSKVEK